MNRIILTAVMHGILILGLAGSGHAEEWIHPKSERLPGDLMGPFVTLADGSVLAASGDNALISKDEGKTWKKHPLFADPAKFLARDERALLRTRDGVIVMAFLNEKEIRRGKFLLDDREELSKFYLPTYVTRSLDEGKTWQPPQKIQDGWCGAIRCLIQLKSDRLVLAGQNLVFDPGRHVVLTYVSDDEGKTWRASNTLELGGRGSHDGAMEATVAELADGRLYMLIRTTRGWFWEATSIDGGLTWKGLRKSGIQSSTCCGTLCRLESGRLVLLWNRSPENQPYNLHSRAELSMAFSEDEAKSWSKPTVIARRPLKEGERYYAARQSYPYVYERRPGELWITTMQGKVRIKLREADFPTGEARLRDSQPITIVALGSSTTARRSGVEKVYEQRLAELLPKQGVSAQLVNSGVGGDTTERARMRFEKDVLAHRPDVVVIQLGANDAAVDVWKNPPATEPRVSQERYTENLRFFIRTLKEQNVRVILMTPGPFSWTPKLKKMYGKPPYDPNDSDGFNVLLTRYAEIARTVAQEESVPLVDVFQAMQKYDRVEGQSADDLFLDGMHPNDRGHKLVADLLAPEILALTKNGKPGP